MKRIKEWLDKKDEYFSIDNLRTAQQIIYFEADDNGIRIGEWIPIYEIKLIGGLVIFSSKKPDVTMPGLILLNDVYAMHDWQDEMIINRDSIEYIREIR